MSTVRSAGSLKNFFVAESSKKIDGAVLSIYIEDVLLRRIPCHNYILKNLHHTTRVVCAASRIEAIRDACQTRVLSPHDIFEQKQVDFYEESCKVFPQHASSIRLHSVRTDLRWSTPTLRGQALDRLRRRHFERQLFFAMPCDYAEIIQKRVLSDARVVQSHLQWLVENVTL